MMQLYDDTCFDCSKLITNKYSTSFSLGIKAFSKKYRAPIYAIYGFVRFADEIVDTFHQHNKEELIAGFKTETYKAIAQQVSLNPVLHAFQYVVNQYQIDNELIEAFLTSMEMDLYATSYDEETYRAYIYGSAEVVGLMCLKVFCDGDEQMYRSLLPAACSLGAAFQKVNFLRDVKADHEERGRVYFPGIDFNNFTEQDKRVIELDIKKDFDDALRGILLLPPGARRGVYIAYIYYRKLFSKISRLPASTVLQQRIRVSDTRKMSLFVQAMLKQRLKAI